MKQNIRNRYFDSQCRILPSFATKGLTPDVVAGLSLGEYSALVAAGFAFFRSSGLGPKARSVHDRSDHKELAKWLLS